MDIDRYTTAELDALDPAQYVHLLNEICGEIKRIGDAKKRAKTDEKSAKVALLFDPSNPNLKAAALEAKATLDILGYELSARKEQAKIIQTQYNNAIRLAR